MIKQDDKNISMVKLAVTSEMLWRLQEIAAEVYNDEVGSEAIPCDATPEMAYWAKTYDISVQDVAVSIPQKPVIESDVMYYTNVDLKMKPKNPQQPDATLKALFWSCVDSTPLEDVVGTGPDGLILIQDVLNKTAELFSTSEAIELAKENNLSLRSIHGTGRFGQRSKVDVKRKLRYLEFMKMCEEEEIKKGAK